MGRTTSASAHVDESAAMRERRPRPSRHGRPGAHRHRSTPLWGAAAVGAGLALAACSSSPATVAARHQTGRTGSSTAPAAGSTSAGGGTVDRATSGKYGAYLVDARGDALYMLSSDQRGRSTCSGACASIWPPLTASGAATAGPGVTTSQVGTIPRPSGSARQVTYDGHPLYTFTGDHAPGQTNGEGIVHFGGTWTLVSPAGQPIGSAQGASGGTTGSASSSSSSSAGGYSY